MYMRMTVVSASLHSLLPVPSNEIDCCNRSITSCNKWLNWGSRQIDGRLRKLSSSSSSSLRGAWNGDVA